MARKRIISEYDYQDKDTSNFRNEYYPEIITVNIFSERILYVDDVNFFIYTF